MNFFSRRIYSGLLHDFYEKSGVNKLNEFKSFIRFKEYISKNSIENYLLKKLISVCFSGKHVIKKFDDLGKGGPDAYVRDRNRIFLFEIKDAYFNSEVIDSFDSDRILAEINTKYNSDKKGTSQLVKQIQNLTETPFEDLGYEELKLKRRNIEIYPILLYTDDFYGLPGINYYLRNEFDKKLAVLGKFDFKKVQTLTFMNINFFIEYLDLLEQRTHTLEVEINRYHRLLKNREKRLKKEKEGDVDLIFNLTDTFESIFQQINDFELKRDGYIKSVYHKLGLHLGL